MFKVVNTNRQFGRMGVPGHLSLPIRAIIILSLVTVILTIVVAVAVLINSHQRELAHAKGEISSLSRILGEQTTRTFEGVALMMRSTRERLADDVGRELELDSVPVTWLLNNRVAGLSQVKSMFVVDKNGLGVNSSRSDFIRNLSLTQRSFFRYYADGATDELFISKPEKAKVDNKWTFYVSTPLRDERGNFRGVLVAAISIDYFESLYESISLDYVDKIQLLNRQGMLLAGKPRDETRFGSNDNNAEALAELQDGKAEIVTRTKNVAGGQQFIAYRNVANYPLIISSAVNEQDALTPWREIAKPIIAGVFLVIAFVLVAAMVLVRNLRRQDLLSAALKDSDERLRQMVSTVRDGMVAIDANHRIVLFNPAAARMFGIDAGNAINHELNEWLANCDHPPIGKNLLRYLEEGLHSPAGLALLGMVELKNGEQKLPVELSLSSAMVQDKILVTAVFRDLTERQRAEQELLDKNRQLEELSASLQGVRESERTRIARELHDELGQLLTGIRMEVSWLGSRLSADQTVLVDKTAAIKNLIDQTIGSVRRISSDLRPLVLDDLGFVAAARWYVDQYAARTGLYVDLLLPEEDLQQDGDVATALFRILQESLTNIARHAKASEVNISLQQKGNDWMLSICDDGVGFAPASLRNNGFGLIGMRERARSLGGFLAVISAPGNGTTINVQIPAGTNQEV